MKDYTVACNNPKIVDYVRAYSVEAAVSSAIKGLQNLKTISYYDGNGIRTYQLEATYNGVLAKISASCFI